MKPGSNPQATIIPLRGKPVAPEHLNAPAAAYWDRIVANLSLQFFLDHDLILLAQYCRALAAADEARTMLEEHGAVDAATGKASPWVAISSQEMRAVHTYSVRLRLCAQSRIDRAAAGLRARPHGVREVDRDPALARYGL